MLKLQILFFLLYVFIPIFFLFRLWRNTSHSLGKWVIATSVLGSYIYCIFLCGNWPFSCGYLFRYPLVIFFPIVAVRSFFKIKREFIFEFPKVRQIFFYGLQLFFLILFTVDIFGAFIGFQLPKETLVELDFPLKGGNFYISHGGSKEFINNHHGVSAQKYALDILQINRFGLRTHIFAPKEVTDFLIFGCPIYSPCDAMVLESCDQYENQKPLQMDPDHPAGNYLVIEKKDSDVLILLAHLLKGSLLVKPGDTIQKGQHIANVGNSGNTSEPHLHIHAVLKNTGDFLFSGKGIPMTFNSRFLCRNDCVK